jgi:NADH:ubiquinone oxidoreductase subunit 6 (subunit J)
MLANPSGRAAYDRLSWEAPLAATVGVVMVGILTMVLANSLGQATDAGTQEQVQNIRCANVLHDQHVARLGGELFSRHLVAVEVAGTLLLAALVGAVAIVVHSRSTGKAVAARAEYQPD